MNNLKKAYELGWIQASKWAKRDDLIADIGSPAYTKDAEAALAIQQTQVEDYKTWYDEAMCASNGDMPARLRKRPQTRAH